MELPGASESRPRKNSESLQVNPGKTPEPASVDPQRAPRLAGVASAKTRVSLLLPTHTHNPHPHAQATGVRLSKGR